MHKALIQEQEVELIVNSVGNAMLLHKGPLKHEYSWAEYDRAGACLNFITLDGDIQPLGFRIHRSFEISLCNTLEMLVIEIGNDMRCQDIKFIKFTKLLE